MDIITCIKERRGKIVFVSKQQMIDHFQPTKKGYIRIPQINVPQDTFCSTVHYDFRRDAFAFLLYHETFEKAPEDSLFPYLNTEVRILEIKTLKDRPERLDE